MTHLSVNVNKLATLRNSREKNLPDVTRLARIILELGAHGITIHPRPDGRHIRLPDVWALHEMIEDWNENAQPKVEFNIEGYPSEDFLVLLEKARPDQCTLVPDPPEALTSNAGWDLIGNEALLAKILTRMAKCKIRTSLFIDPKTFDGAQESALLRLKPSRIELYTESFADHFASTDCETVTNDYRRVASVGKAAGIGVNAGHDLNQQNLGYLLRAIPWIAEVSIGHALVCEALEQGLSTTVENYLKIVAAP